MPRLIDANALQRKICGAKCGCAYEDCGCEGDCQFDFFISNAPTVDAVEVEKYIELREQYDKIFLAYHEVRDDFVSYVCGGVPNPSPFCLNKRKGCCDCYGWCKNDDKCQGFNPAEVILDGAKMDGDGNG